MSDDDPPGSELVSPVIAWFETHQRDLPWREPDRSPWGVLVSEVMLQQTPVARVLPAWRQWTARWPEPAGLAVEPAGEAILQWGRLGYPRRALRLHEAARRIVQEHGGEVPRDEAALRGLPGVGEYTAAAVRAFAFGERSVVLDTNVRRVLARALVGRERASPWLSAPERSMAEAVLPRDPATAARWSVATMELGALVCTSADPACDDCPVASGCAWRAAGKPAHSGPRRPVQRFEGTDRQVRGLLMAVLREGGRPVGRDRLDQVWVADPVQRERALAGLVADGLAERTGPDEIALPSIAARGSMSRPATPTLRGRPPDDPLS